MAKQANDMLSNNMITADQLAANANAAWGPGDIQLGELQPRLSLNESYARYVEALEEWPYELGANGPTAYDCSSTVLYGMRHTTGNYNLGDYTADDIFNKFTTQASWGERGDLLFYDWNSDAKIDHVTTILGGGKMLHPSSSSNILKIVQTSKPNSWYPNKSVFIRRINWGSLTKKR